MIDSTLFSPKYAASYFHRSSKRVATAPPLRFSSRPNSQNSLPRIVEEWAGEGLLFALFAGAITAAACSLVKVWSFVGSDALDHTVRVFVP